MLSCPRFAGSSTDFMSASCWERASSISQVKFAVSRRFRCGNRYIFRETNILFLQQMLFPARCGNKRRACWLSW